ASLSPEQANQSRYPLLPCLQTSSIRSAFIPFSAAHFYLLMSRRRMETLFYWATGCGRSDLALTRRLLGSQSTWIRRPIRSSGYFHRALAVFICADMAKLMYLC